VGGLDTIWEAALVAIAVVIDVAAAGGLVGCRTEGDGVGRQRGGRVRWRGWCLLLDILQDVCGRAGTDCGHTHGIASVDTIGRHDELFQGQDRERLGRIY
jgi:hypothetical protein